jgi:O-antigen ligase
MWRMGLFRAPSLLGHPNGIAMFVLFFWTIEVARAKEFGLRNSWIKLAFLGAAIIFSVSRTAIITAFMTPLFLSLRFRKLFFVALPILLLGIISFMYIQTIDAETHAEEMLTHGEYRKFALGKSFEIFSDNPVAGVGPGMYGGHISIKYNSPIYAQYNFTGRFYEYLFERVGSIEQQWSQILAELGLAGAVLFVILMVAPYVILRRLMRKETDGFFLAFEAGLMVMPLQMFCYMLTFTVTQQQEWLFPYFAFVGMLVGSQRRANKQQKSWLK